MGPGLLRHDQHRHLRARARGAAARADRPAVRLLEGAVPAAARDGPADVRLRDGGLLAGHRQPRPVPAGELRRARRKVRLEHPRHPLRGNIWIGEGVDLHDLDALEGPAFIGNYCRIAPDATVGPYSVLGDERDAARARADLPRDHRRVDVHRPQHARRGRDRRPLVRPARSRARARRRRDRRRGDDRRRERDHARRPHLSVQGGRDRLADPREPDLGVARHVEHLREATVSPGSSTSTSRRTSRCGSPQPSARR